MTHAVLKRCYTVGTSQVSRRSPVQASPTLLLPTCLPLAAIRRIPRSHFRLFHSTPARRLFETSDQVLIAVAAVGAGWFIASRILPYMIRKAILSRVRPIAAAPVPPLTWANSADPQTAAGVLSAVGAGFRLARSCPVAQRDNALRQATFALPYEIARFNKDAPEFRIEDMGPSPELSADAEEAFDAMDISKPTFDLQQDTRVFLYYPKNAKKATAAFLTINTDFEVPDPQKVQAFPMLPPGSSPERAEDIAWSSRKNHSLVKLALYLWVNQFEAWEKEAKAVIENCIEPGQLPIIFVFNDKTCGSIFDQELQVFSQADSTAYVLGLVEPETKAS